MIPETRTKETADEDGSGVETCGYRVQFEVIRIGYEDIEAVQHRTIITAGLERVSYEKIRRGERCLWPTGP